MSTPRWHEPSGTVLAIARQFYPRRYRRHHDLRSFDDAREWARQLDWRNNPYERFLLERELIRYIEAATHLDWHRRIISSARDGEIAALVTDLLDAYAREARRRRLDVFSSILVRFPWEFAYRHRWLRQSRLCGALSSLPERQGLTRRCS